MVHQEVESVVGHRFRDPELLAAACDTSARAFGVLEHLGDAIGDLAVGLACWSVGRTAAEASALVANDALDAVFERHLRGLVRARSGDVVEALVGAVHIDGGFDAGSLSAVRLCAPGMTALSLPHRDLDELVPGDAGSDLRWVGSLAIDAIVTDLAVARLGVTETTQRALSGLRARRTETHALAGVARAAGFTRGDDRDVVNDFRLAVGTTLVGAGWTTTTRLLGPLLDL